jgi:hypothetical protein
MSEFLLISAFQDEWNARYPGVERVRRGLRRHYGFGIELDVAALSVEAIRRQFRTVLDVAEKQFPGQGHQVELERCVRAEGTEHTYYVPFELWC